MSKPADTSREPPKITVAVSPRGQLTLPAELRRRLGIREGSMLTVEERQGGLFLRPAAVVELTMYSDREIAAWDAADELGEEERRLLAKKLESR